MNSAAALAEIGVLCRDGAPDLAAGGVSWYTTGLGVPGGSRSNKSPGAEREDCG